MVYANRGVLLSAHDVKVVTEASDVFANMFQSSVTCLAIHAGSLLRVAAVE
jgi:hypothetical protein